MQDDKPLRSRGVSLIKSSIPMGGPALSISRYSRSYLRDTKGSINFLAILMASLFGVSVIALITVAQFSSVRERLFPMTRDGRMATVLPVSMAVDKEIVVAWANSALLDIFRFAHHDQDLRIPVLRRFFTESGWSSFNRFLERPISGYPSIRSQLQNDSLVLNSFPAQTPSLIDQSLQAGVYRYKLFCKIRVRMESRLVKTSELFNITIDVIRVGADVNPSGLAIDAIYFGQ